MKARMTFIRNVTRYWLPVIFWTCFIFWISTKTFSSQHTSLLVEKILFLLFPGISSQQAEMVNFFLRRTGHVTGYFILGILLFRAFRSGSAASWNWRWFWGAFIVVVLWAIMDEFHQSLVPTRTASLVDVGIDTAGGTLAQLVCALWHGYRKNQRGNSISKDNTRTSL